MAITGYFGKPGSGKSYTIVAEVIVRAVCEGRRVLTNCAGVDPEKVRAFCFDKVTDPDQLGHVVLFDGLDALEPGFFPVQDRPDEKSVVLPGDLLVFDEWAVYWPRRGKHPNPDLVPFLRYHRHYVDEATGVACDVVIATQIPSDLHQDYRALIQTSYNFVKLTAVGAKKAYKWNSYQGHLLNKDSLITNGGGFYDPNIFPLYKSYDATVQATELKTDSRDNIWKRSLLYMIAAGAVCFLGGVWYIYHWFTDPGAHVVEGQQVATAASGQNVQNAPAVASVPWRIIGQVVGDHGIRVVVVNEAGAMRVVTPETFRFDEDRPVSGTVDGQRAEAEQFVQVDPTLLELGEGVQ